MVMIPRPESLVIPAQPAPRATRGPRTGCRPVPVQELIPAFAGMTKRLAHRSPRESEWVYFGNDAQ